MITYFFYLMNRFNVKKYQENFSCFEKTALMKFIFVSWLCFNVASENVYFKILYIMHWYQHNCIVFFFVWFDNIFMITYLMFDI